MNHLPAVLIRFFIPRYVFVCSEEFGKLELAGFVIGGLTIIRHKTER